MNGHLQIVATLIADRAAADSVRRLLVTAVEAFRKEPGCAGYVLLEDRQQAGRFMTYETWLNEGALAQHMESPTMKALEPKLNELLEGKVRQDFLSVLVDT